MDSLPDFETYALFHRRDVAPDFDRIEAALIRSEKIAAGLAGQFPNNAVFADHLAATRAAIARLPEARSAQARGDRRAVEAIATELAALFTARGRAGRLAELGLTPT